MPLFLTLCALRVCQAHEHSGTWREVFMLGIPTFFDLVATILMNVGLVSVTASVYQMLRGAEMLFAALFAVVFLGRKLNRYHYGGIACCLVSPLSK
jgi:drug/metabolite transporter (DMT)-like permease